jgi:hypothetical protein
VDQKGGGGATARQGASYAGKGCSKNVMQGTPGKCRIGEVRIILVRLSTELGAIRLARGGGSFFRTGSRQEKGSGAFLDRVRQLKG